METRAKNNVVIYSLLAVLTVSSLFVLFHLREQFDTGLQRRIADLQRVFSNRALLKSPSDYKISFAEIEAEVRKYENRGDFGTIQIQKQFGDNQRTVYPFYLPALSVSGLVDSTREPDKNSGNANLFYRLFSDHRSYRLPLTDGSELLGNLVVSVNQGALRTVNSVIWLMALMLAASLTFLATQFRRQEKFISATTIELDEKRRELVRLERLALAGQLSANILHDLKKPVLNIRNEAEEALNPTGDGAAESPKTIFSRMREQSDFFLSVLREGGFDRFVRSREEREYVDINDLLDRSLALVKYEQGSVAITRNYSIDLPAVLAEPVRLIQVFSNLILNACQAMDGKGQLEIASSADESKRVVIRIADTGPGIAADKLDKVFEPFYTTKPEGQGTGLGLYIVRDILKDLGGDINLASQPGQTVFTITLPGVQ